MKVLIIALIATLFCSTINAAELKISGFGTIGGGLLLDGDGFIADYPNLGIYEDGFDISQETRLGLQGSAVFDENISGTLQLMTRAANDFEVEVEWLYSTIKVSNETNVQIGRMRMPVYYFSEYMDVGYTFPWVRIPSDTYSLDLTNFNGIRLNHSFNTAMSDFRFSIYTGKEENIDDELMGYLFSGFSTQIDRDYDDIVGLVLDMTSGRFTGRVTYTRASMLETQTLNDSSLVDIPYDIKFTDVFIRYDFDSGISIMTEYNEFTPFYKSYFASVVYQINEIAYYANWSQFDLDTPFEKHNTTSIGFRYEMGDGYAFKVDISSMQDEGFNPFSGQPNPVYKADPDGSGDVTMLSFALDFVF